MRRLRVIALLAVTAGLGMRRAAADAPPLPATEAERQKLLADAPPAQRPGLLVRMAEQLEFTDPELALDYARRAQTAAPTQADEVRAGIRVASAERALGDYNQAITDAKAVLQEAEAMKDDRLRAEALLVIARSDWGLTDLPAAISTFQEGLDLAQATGDDPAIVDLRIGLGIAVDEVGERARGREQFQLALALAEKLGDASRMGSALTDLGNTYIGEGDLAAARSCYERSQAAFRRAGNQWGLATALINLGSVAEKKGDFATALGDYQNARSEYARMKLKRQLANAERQLGTLLAKMGRMTEARAHYSAALALAKELGSHTVLANIHQEWSRSEERAGNYREALEADRSYAAEHEAALGEASRKAVAALNARFDAEHRDHEITALRAQEAVQTAEQLRARARIYLFAALAVAGLLVVAAAYNRQRAVLVAERRTAADAQTAREAAEQADRVKTRLLGIASHDLKGPLGNISQITDELRLEREGAGGRDERLDWIGVEAARLTRLVQDLLDTAALETGRLELRLGPVDLGAVVQGAVTEQQWQIQEKRQRLDWQPPVAGQTMVEGDADRLRQVIGNVLGNAIKFAPKDTVVTLGLTRHAGRVVFTVRDQGPGISAADREGLFAPFSRLSAKPTGRESSHGLGLSIAHEIVRLHGGEITVESEVGKGATFRISLPA